MVRFRGGAKKKKPKPRKDGASAAPEQFAPEFVLDAAPGCHIALFRDPRSAAAADDDDDEAVDDAPPPRPAWVLGKLEPFDPSDYGLDDAAAVPDLSLAPDDHVLTAINATERLRVRTERRRRARAPSGATERPWAQRSSLSALVRRRSAARAWVRARGGRDATAGGGGGSDARRPPRPRRRTNDRTDDTVRALVSRGRCIT